MLPCARLPPIRRCAPPPAIRSRRRGPGAVGHASTAGANPGERVRRRGGDIYVGEVIAYGIHTPVDIIRSLVIDDGVAARGHRALLLSAGYHYAGGACGAHRGYGMMCVVDLAATPGGRPAVPAN